MLQPEKPEPQNWYNAKMVLISPKDLGFWDKYIIERKGRKDVRRAQIGFSDDGVIHSSFCTEMLESSNKIIERICQRAHIDLSKLRPYLDFKQEEFDNNLYKHDEYVKVKTRIIEDISNSRMMGDEEVSKATLNARISKRISENTFEINNKIEIKENELNSITNDTKRPNHDFMTRKEIVYSNKKIVDHELGEKISLYLQGAWRLIDAPQFQVTAPETTNEPIKRLEEAFPNYCFSIKKRCKQLGLE